MSKLEYLGAIPILLLCECRTPPANQVAGLHKLTAPEIVSVLVGNTGYSDNEDGMNTVVTYYAPDAHVRVVSSRINDEGTFWITNDGTFCSVFPKLHDGRQTCQTLYHFTSDMYRWQLPNGQINNETIVSGNADRL